MKKIIKIKLAVSQGKRAFSLLITYPRLVTNTATFSTVKSSEISVYNYKEALAGSFAANRGKRFIYNLLTLVFIFITSLTSAQNVLVGLTSKGGPEGKGTAYSIN